MIFLQNSEKISPGDTQGEVDFNPQAIIEKIDTWVDGFTKLIPNIIMAFVVIVVFYFLGRLVKSLILKTFKGRDRDNLGRMLGGLMRAIVIGLGVMFGFTIVIPSLTPGSIFAGLGVSSVAIGFAFKDILQNWLAGLLILIRQPFEVKDQIEVGDYEGTVETIETRATIIKTYAGERVVIPNSEVYTNSVKVKTAFDIRRRQYDVGIGYADDIEEAINTITQALNKIDGVDNDKGVEVLPWDLAASWVTLRVRWWCKSDRASVVATTVQVIKAIKLALDEKSIDMPYETLVHLFHDQTEEADGDRSKQREGWPADGGKGTTPRWRAKKELQDSK